MAASVANLTFADYLREATLEVFETMAFLAVDPGPPREPTDGALRGELVCSLCFTGSASGVVLFSCPISLARSITANMLGIEEDEITQESEVGDAMGEVTNMIAGGIKSRWVAEGARMELTIPVVSMASSVQANFGGTAAVEGARIDFRLEDREDCISVEMRLDKHSGEA